MSGRSCLREATSQGQAGLGVRWGSMEEGQAQAPRCAGYGGEAKTGPGADAGSASVLQPMLCSPEQVP